MARRRPSRGELEAQLAAARRAIERLEAGVAASAESIHDDDLEELTLAVEQVGSLAEELHKVRSGRRRAVLEAANQRRRYRELFELAPDGYLATDGSGVVLHANRAAGDLLGVSPDRLEGKPLVLYFREPDRVLFHRHLRELRPGGSVVEWNAHVHSRDGRGIPVAVRCSASLNDPDGTLRFLLHDLTDVRRAEQHELALAEKSAEEARSLEQTKSNFLRLASHELRGPLALIRGYISMLSDGTFGELPDDAAAALPVLSARVEEMSRMVDEMLDAARMEDGRLQLHIVTLDLAEVTTEAVEAMQALAAESHEIVIAAHEVTTVKGDQRRLATIITNLLDNAIKYSPQGGEIAVDVATRDGHGEVTITDHGLGIPGNDLQGIFKPFGRVVTSETSHIPGTGLGLHLSRELARAQGGDLAVSSKEGEGTTVTLRVPLAG